MIYLIYFILICVAVFFIRKFLSKYKFNKIMALTIFTGAVKVGKTGVSLACTVQLYKKVLRRWKIKSLFQKLFRKPISEKPLLYSNIPLCNVEYCKLTADHILRKARFNFGSVVFVDEASLLADSQLIKDKDLNVDLLKFFKLFGHETHCGYAVFNSQQLTDLHYSLRRCCSQYFYIHHTSKYIPFFTLALLREERYSEDGTTVNVYDKDVEDSLKKVIFRKSVFKKYDCCAYSSLTDDLPTKNINCFINKKDRHLLKASEIVSFRPEFQHIFDERKKITFEKMQEDFENSKKEGLI